MADEPAKKNPWITIAIIVVAVLAVDVVGGFLIFKFAIPMVYKSDSAVSVFEGKKEKEGKGTLEVPLLKPLEPMVLNPANSSGEILATEIVLEAHDKAVIDEITVREAQIRDGILTYLSHKTVAELNDITKRDQFKKDILDRVNSQLRSGKATGLYTKSWIIQFE